MCTRTRPGPRTWATGTLRSTRRGTGRRSVGGSQTPKMQAPRQPDIRRAPWMKPLQQLQLRCCGYHVSLASCASCCSSIASTSASSSPPAPNGESGRLMPVSADRAGKSSGRGSNKARGPGVRRTERGRANAQRCWEPAHPTEAAASCTAQAARRLRLWRVLGGRFRACGRARCQQGGGEARRDAKRTQQRRFRCAPDGWKK